VFHTGKTTQSLAGSWEAGIVAGDHASVPQKRSKNDAFVPGAAGNTLPVEILQQGNRILAGNARQVFERGNVDEPLGLMCRRIPPQEDLQLIQRPAVKKHVPLYAHQVSIID